MAAPTVIAGAVTGTTWQTAGTAAGTFNYSTLGGAQPGDLVLAIFSCDLTFVGSKTMTAVQPGWDQQVEDQGGSNYVNVFWKILDETDYNIAHAFNLNVDSDFSRGWIIIRDIDPAHPYRLQPWGAKAPGEYWMVEWGPETVDQNLDPEMGLILGIEPEPVVSGDLIITVLCERDNLAKPPATPMTEIGYSPDIRWEANLGIYYRTVTVGGPQRGGLLGSLVEQQRYSAVIAASASGWWVDTIGWGS